MLSKWSSALALVGVLLVPLAVRAQVNPQEQSAPALIVRVESFDAAVQGFKTLARAAGQEEIGNQVESLIKAQTGPGGLSGVDTKKPVGVYVKMTDDATIATGAVMVPVKDEKGFVKLLESLDFKVKKNDKYYTLEHDRIPVPDMGMRFANGYAYFTALKADVLADNANLLTPAQMFPANVKALVSGVLRVDQIPKAVRDLAIAQLNDKLEQAKKKAQDEADTPAQKKLAGEAIEYVNNQFQDFLNGATAVAGQFDVDEKSNQVTIEITVDGKKNSQLTKTIADLAKTPSNFGPLVKKPAEAVQQVHFVLPTELKKSFAAVIDEAMEKGLQEETDAKKREFAKKFFDAIKPTLHAGDFDIASNTQIHADGSLTVVGGAKLQQGGKVEQTLRELHKQLPPGEQAKIQLDAAKAGAVSIHQVNIKDNLKAKEKKILGEDPLYVAFRQDAVFIALGKGGLDALKAAVTSPPGPTGKCLYYELKLAPILGAVLQQEHEKAALKKAFAMDPGLVRFSVEGGQRLQIKMSSSLSVLQFGVAVNQLSKSVRFQAVPNGQ